MPGIAGIVVIVIFVLYIINSIKILAEYERGVIFRLGRLLGMPKGPGIILVFAPIDRIVRISLRQEALEVATLSLSPIIPHVTHVLWQALGRETALLDERWPEPDATALAQEAVEIVVQVNGKLRGRVRVAVGADQATAQTAALEDEHVRRFVDKPIRKVIFVPGKLINLVV